MSDSGLKILLVFGTRPEAIKMAPVIAEFNRVFLRRCVVCVTAQHRQMLDQVLELFGIEPDYDLDIMKPGQSLPQITCNVLMGVKSVLEVEQPDLTLVHGDTTTTLGASLAAYYAGCRIGHAEAGLSTGNKYAPFPEEINRKITGVIADYHFAPTPLARRNLLKEGVPENRIIVTGNTVIDALMHVKKMIDEDRAYLGGMLLLLINVLTTISLCFLFSPFSVGSNLGWAALALVVFGFSRNAFLLGPGAGWLSWPAALFHDLLPPFYETLNGRRCPDPSRLRSLRDCCGFPPESPRRFFCRNPKR